MTIEIINGPNLNLLGVRQPEIYGNQNFIEYLEQLRSSFPEVKIGHYQSNSEGAIIDAVQKAGFRADGIVLNAGAYTHTSLAIADAVAAIVTPVIEVHISNIFAREPFRHKSFTAPYCSGVISGFGLDVYRLAIQAFLRKEAERNTE